MTFVWLYCDDFGLSIFEINLQPIMFDCYYYFGMTSIQSSFSGCSNCRGHRIEVVYISCSWHQTPKPPILFSPIFSTNFSQLEQLIKKTKVFSRFWTIWKVCFLFQMLKLRKFHRKIWGNKIGCLVVWCHEQDISFNSIL